MNLKGGNNMNNKIWDYISTILIIINGVICTIYHQEIYVWLPSICAIVLLIKGTIKMVEGIKEKDYASLEKKKLERSIVIIAVAIAMLLQLDNALVVVCIFWGLSGLNKSANYLNEALYYFYKGKNGFLSLIKAIIEFTLSILLIFDPLGKVTEHILILGFELIFEGIFELISIHNGKEELID
ncbi:hypothetical protein HMPREF0216_01958 [Clostridium celatum DSM 1785]|uniref:Uncharacterized protein n=2 Tax=Clostridium celatum TaxID=36834 RepID=L1QFT8_9CLOT|nr:hypothetical protein HMPREF0216_01958 [Clostridium celatum DSM 1785]